LLGHDHHRLIAVAERRFILSHRFLFDLRLMVQE
jgi:hypothetical protein